MNNYKHKIEARIIHKTVCEPKMLAFTRDQLLKNLHTSIDTGSSGMEETFKFLLKMFDEH